MTRSPNNLGGYTGLKLVAPRPTLSRNKDNLRILDGLSSFCRELETEDNMINIPPQLPPFRFPPADGMTFNMPISDNVSDVQICENEAHRKEIQTDQEVTETRSQDKHFDGINIGVHGTSVGFQGGISQQHSINNTVKASKVILKEDTIFWNLKAPMTRLDDDGLNGEEFLTFVLTKKPVRFKYKCRVTHVVEDGVKKTTERISRDWSFLKLR
ncbi:hypothetical protein Clacol_004638 [Clathrus columnatus]|uniref:Uncharacterized protein n=1 Tax=Clathrus columnatus TaxID=1419009 RepID=A0AAV5A718_9AGAM|nr:hypothetical protein Clacol_004638 [Clathrus columnatus]